MRRRIAELWKLLLPVLALAATSAALQVQWADRTGRQAAVRLAASRLDEALSAAQDRRRADLLGELRSQLPGPAPGLPAGAPLPGGPLPNSVLRRLEEEDAPADALQQVVETLDPREAFVLSHLNESLAALARRMEESDRALRRDLEAARAALRRELEAAERTADLVLLALLALVLHLLVSAWPRRGGGTRREEGELPAGRGSAERG